MLAFDGTGRLPANPAAWLAALVTATVAGAICFAVFTWTFPPAFARDFQPSLEEVAGSTLFWLHEYLLLSTGVLAALVLLRVTSAIPTRFRRRQPNIENSRGGPDGLRGSAVFLVLGCVLLLGVGETSRRLGQTVLPDPPSALEFLLPVGNRLFAVGSGLFITAGVVAALASAQALDAVVRHIRARSTDGDSQPFPREDADAISGHALVYRVVGLIAVAAVGSICVWLGLRDYWLDLQPYAALVGITASDLRPDVIDVTGEVLRVLGYGFFVGAGALVALACLQQSVRASDRRAGGRMTSARPLVTGVILMVLAAAIVFWLERSVVLADLAANDGPRSVADSIIRFRWIVLWEALISEVVVSLIVRDLGGGLIVGTVVATILTMLPWHARVQPGGACAHRDVATRPVRAVAPGFVAALLVGGLCLSLGAEILTRFHEFALAEPPRSFAGVLVPILLGVSRSLFIGAGVLAAAIVSLALGGLQRRASERRSRDSPA